MITDKKNSVSTFVVFCFDSIIPGPDVIKKNSCSTQLSMNFKVLIHTETAKINGNFWFKSQKLVIYLQIDVNC